MEIDIQQLVSIARRRWWVVVLITAVAGLAAFGFSTRQVDQYSTSAKLLVISGDPERSNEFSSLQASRSLAETYRLLIETGPVLDRVIDTLSLSYDAGELDQKITTSIVGTTQLVEISVSDTDPAQAALIANTVAEEFRAYITDQVDPRIGAQVEIADPAREPKEPFAPQPMRSLLLGAFVGALLGAGVVALLEFLDNTVKPEGNVQSLIDAPVLATISQLPKITPGGQQVYTLTQPQSGAAEAMRLLRTNLEFASATNPIKTLTITSSGPGEGKSTTAANLGVVMAQSGMTTAIIDADLRKPTQNRIFGVENHTGLTTLLTHPDEPWETVARKVALQGLYLIPSGPIPPNPTDLLRSDRFANLLKAIQADVDMIIIDSPPLLSASDALVTARQTDGIAIIAHSGKTRIDALRHAAHSVHQSGLRLVGVILNRQKGQRGASYYGDYYGAVPAQTSNPAPTPGD